MVWHGCLHLHRTLIDFVLSPLNWYGIVLDGLVWSGCLHLHGTLVDFIFSPPNRLSPKPFHYRVRGEYVNLQMEYCVYYQPPNIHYIDILQLSFNYLKVAKIRRSYPCCKVHNCHSRAPRKAT